MGSILDVEVAHQCRIVCAASLQYLNIYSRMLGLLQQQLTVGIKARTAHIFGCDVILRLLYRISTFLLFQCTNFILENNSMV